MKHIWPLQILKYSCSIFIIISYIVPQWQVVQSKEQTKTTSEVIPDYVIEALTMQLQSPNVASRKTAILTLSRIKSKQAVPLLIQGLNDTHIFIRLLSAKALAQHKTDKSVAPSLIGRLKKEKEIFVQKAIIESLANLNDQRAFWILNKFSKSSNLLIRKVAIASLNKLKQAHASRSSYLDFLK